MPVLPRLLATIAFVIAIATAIASSTTELFCNTEALVPLHADEPAVRRGRQHDGPPRQGRERRLRAHGVPRQGHGQQGQGQGQGLWHGQGSLVCVLYGIYLDVSICRCNVFVSFYVHMCVCRHTEYVRSCYLPLVLRLVLL